MPTRKRRSSVSRKKRSVKKRRSYKRRSSVGSRLGRYAGYAGKAVAAASAARAAYNMANDFWDNKSVRGYAGAAGGYGSGYLDAAGSYLMDPTSAPRRFTRYLTGRGDYRAAGGKIGMGQSVPTMVGGGGAQHYVRIVHKEFITDLTGSSAFSNTVYPINPGLATTFPWLSQVAGNFEEYEFEALSFVFNSTSADALNSTNTALGTVIGAVQYNSLNTPFSSKQQMENYEFAKSAKPSCSNIYPVECAPGENPLDHYYIRQNTVPTGADQRLYDVGDFQIATQGMQAAANIGELWVTYSVRLYKPRTADPGLDVLTSHYQLGAGIDATHMWGTTVPTAAQTGSNFSVTFTNGSANLITMPATITSGNFLLCYQVTGTSAALTGPILVNSWTNAAPYSLFKGNTSNRFQVNVGGTVTTQYVVIAFTVTGASAVLSFGGPDYPTSITSGDVLITQLNTNVLTSDLESKVSSIIRSDQVNPKVAYERRLKAEADAKKAEMDEFERWQEFENWRESKQRQIDLDTQRSLPVPSEEVDDKEMEDFRRWKAAQHDDIELIPTPVKRAGSPTPSERARIKPKPPSVK